MPNNRIAALLNKPAAKKSGKKLPPPRCRAEVQQYLPQMCFLRELLDEPLGNMAAGAAERMLRCMAKMIENDGPMPDDAGFLNFNPRPSLYPKTRDTMIEAGVLETFDGENEGFQYTGVSITDKGRKLFDDLMHESKFAIENGWSPEACAKAYETEFASDEADENGEDRGFELN